MLYRCRSRVLQTRLRVPPRRLVVLHARRTAEVLYSRRVRPGNPPASARPSLAHGGEAARIRGLLAHLQEAAARVVLDEDVLRRPGRRPPPEPQRRSRSALRGPDREPVGVEARPGGGGVEDQPGG